MWETRDDGCGRQREFFSPSPNLPISPSPPPFVLYNVRLSVADAGRR
ncbi:MAG: hypothetical protein ACHBN1_08200 [Heteroscytonema crispum UTEX LB 1556]